MVHHFTGRILRPDCVISLVNIYWQHGADQAGVWRRGRNLGLRALCLCVGVLCKLIIALLLLIVYLLTQLAGSPALVTIKRSLRPPKHPRCNICHIHRVQRRSCWVPEHRDVNHPPLLRRLLRELPLRQCRWRYCRHVSSSTAWNRY